MKRIENLFLNKFQILAHILGQKNIGYFWREGRQGGRRKGGREEEGRGGGIWQKNVKKQNKIIDHTSFSDSKLDTEIIGRSVLLSYKKGS